MAALSKHAILCIAAYALVHRRRRRRHNAQPQRVRRVWIKPHIGRHDEQGAYENLVEELRHDPAEFETFHRVNPATFDFLSSESRRRYIQTKHHIQSFNIGSQWVSYVCQLCVTEMFHCDWSVALMRQMSLTRTHHATVIGPTTVAFVKSTGDNCLWCAHTMQQSSFRRLCVQQTTKIAWCVPG